jgi:hypothetical protein
MNTILNFNIIENANYGGGFTYGTPILRTVDSNFEEFYHRIDMLNMVVHQIAGHGVSGSSENYIIVNKLGGFLIRWSRLLGAEIANLAREYDIDFSTYLNSPPSASQCSAILNDNRITDSDFYNRVVRFYMKDFFENTNLGKSSEKQLKESINFQ